MSCKYLVHMCIASFVSGFIHSFIIYTAAEITKRGKDMQMSWAAASQIVETESLLGEKSCRFPHRTEVPGGRKVCVQHSLHGNSGGHHTQGTTSHTPVNVQKSSPGVGFALLPIPRRVSFYASFSSL